jgi:hypothetical protein
VATINSRDDRLPPASFAFPAAAGPGRCELPRELADDQRYDIHVSAVSAAGVATPATRLDVAAATAPQARRG